jgi:ATP/ADP translocase
MMRIQNVLVFLNIRPGEGKPVALALSYAILSYTANILAYTVAYTLFLREFDAQRLPYIYIAVSIFVILLSTFYLQLSQRYPLSLLLLGNLSLILATMILYRLSLAVAAARWLFFSLPIWYGVINILMFLTFWNLLGRLFNLQQGKRLFGLLSSGQQMAIILTGFAVPPVVARIGALNLLWAAAGAVCAALVVLLYLLQSFAASFTSTTASSDDAQGRYMSAQSAGGGDYVRMIFVMFTFFGLGVYFVDNIFYAQIRNQLPSETQLASFLGLFNGVASGLSLIGQLFIANRLISRYGVRLIILLTPTLILLAAVLFITTGTFFDLPVLLFGLAVGMNLTRYTMDAFDNSSANLLYQPLPTTLRTHMQTTIDGILYPGAIGLTGLVLLFLTNVLHFDSLRLSYVLVPILVGWIALAVLVGRGYAKRVQQALRQRIFQGAFDFQLERTSLDGIRAGLNSAHPGGVIYALDLLQSISLEETTASLPNLLRHSSPLVRLDVLERIETLGVADALPAVDDCFVQDPEPKVRSAALRTLAALDAANRFDQLYPLLEAPDLDLRKGVMVGLLRNGEMTGVLAVGQSLARLAEAPNRAERMAAAQVLGESKLTGFYHPLFGLLSDEDAAVRRMALAAAGQLKHPKLWPAVIEQLASSQTRSAAQEALLAGGVDVLAALKLALERAANDRPRLVVLIGTCGRLRQPQLANTLLAYLEYPDVQVRAQAINALQRCGYQADTARRPEIERQIQSELAQAAWSLAVLVDLGEAAEVVLLRNALQESLAQQRTRLFYLLSWLYTPKLVLQAGDVLGAPLWRKSKDSSEEQKAYALETIDLLVSPLFKRSLVTFLDTMTVEQKAKRLVAEFSQQQLSVPVRLWEIVTGSDAWVSPWLKATAVYTVAHLFYRSAGMDETLDKAEGETLASAIAALATSAQSALVRETASNVLTTIERCNASRGWVEQGRSEG